MEEKNKSLSGPVFFLFGFQGIKNLSKESNKDQGGRWRILFLIREALVAVKIAGNCERYAILKISRDFPFLILCFGKR